MPPQKEAPPPEIPGYRVLKTIGRGGFGAVYLAEQESLGGMVAIKSFLPEGLTELQRREFMERFRREARLLAKLRGHENIVQVFDWTKDAGGNDYIVMEHVDGYSVAALQKLQPTNQLPIAEAVRIVREAAKGLQAAHETGIVHRDVKPENLMILEKSGRVKVMDFGTAQGGADGETRLTRHGVAFGTPFYMSPEQFHGANMADVRSDVYSLAVVLYNLVAGRVPYYDTNPFSLAKKIETEKAPLPSLFRPGLYPPLEAIILKGMARDPDQRYQTMLDFERALGKFIEKFDVHPQKKYGNETETAPEGSFFNVKRGAKTVPAAPALDDSIARRSDPGSPYESHRIPADDGATSPEPSAPSAGPGPLFGGAAPVEQRHSPATIEFDFEPAPPPIPKGLRSSTGKNERLGERAAAKPDEPADSTAAAPADSPSATPPSTPAPPTPAPSRPPDPPPGTAKMAPFNPPAEVVGNETGRSPSLPKGPATAPFALPIAIAAKKREAAAQPAPPPASRAPKEESAPRPPPAPRPAESARPAEPAPRPAPPKPSPAATGSTASSGGGGLMISLLLIVAIAAVGAGLWYLGQRPAPAPTPSGGKGANERGALESRVGESGDPASDGMMGVTMEELGVQGAKAAELNLGMGQRIILRWCPEGSFTMGSSVASRGTDPDERPTTEVSFAKGFWISETEVTIGQWRAFASRAGYATPLERDPNAESWRRPNAEADESHPVAYLSWNDANKFCEWLTRESPCVVMLPTEAEWEYACRAGTGSPFAWGPDWEDGEEWMNSKDAAYARQFRDSSAASELRDGYPFSSPAGSFKANAWGLKDMHGNVWEWCRDLYGPYKGGKVEDPLGPSSGDKRVIRGGSWSDHPLYARSANRGSSVPSTASQDIGFRVVAYPR